MVFVAKFSTMADLYHLLDEVETQEPEESQDWEQQDREYLQVPPELQDAAQKRFEPTPMDERVDLDDFLQSESEVLYNKLQSLWSQEINAPEILSYDSETVEGLTNALRQQEELIDNGEVDTGNTNVDALTESILKVDADRAKFLLSDLLKMRLQKIEEYPLHMRENGDRLSEKEVSVCVASRLNWSPSSLITP
jgi:hypothetical protein